VNQGQEKKGERFIESRCTGETKDGFGEKGGSTSVFNLFAG